MSIIQAKATRETGKPESPDRALYEDKTTNRISQIPFYVGASLGALILYLKNSLTAFAGNDELLPEEQYQAFRDHTRPTQTPAFNEVQDADLKKLCYTEDSALVAATNPDDTRHFVSSSLKPNAVHISPAIFSEIQFDSLDASFVPKVDFSSQNSSDLPRVAAYPSNDNRLGGSPASTTGSGNDGHTPSALSQTDGSGTSTPSTKTPPTTPPKQPINHAPKVTGQVALPDTFFCNLVSIFAAELLKNAVDPDGDKLSVTNVKIHGTSLVLVGDHYVYHGDDVGFVTVTYNVTDGKAAVADSAVLNFLPRPAILGTSDDDTLVGTDCGDNISAGAGNDHVHGNDGNDVIYGDSGDDTIYGDAGDDVIYGGDGNDTLYGGQGNNTIFGGNGDDIIFGGTGKDFLFGGSGCDLIYASVGGGSIFGGSGRDWIHDGAGADKIFGDSGNDTVFAKADGANDYFDGGSGINKLSYASVTISLDINLNTGIATSTGTGSGIGTDQFNNFKVVEGGSGGTVFHAKVTVAEPSATVDVSLIPPDDSNNHSHDTATNVQAEIETTLVHPEVHSDRPLVSAHPVPSTIETIADEVLVARPAGEPLVSAVPVDLLDHEVNTENVVTLVREDRPLVSLNAPDDETASISPLPSVTASDGYTYLGGSSIDTLDYSGAQQSIVVDLVHGTAHGKEIGNDFFSSIENFIGGAGDDAFVAAGQGVARHAQLTDEPDLPDTSLGPVQSVPCLNTNTLILTDVSGDKVTGAAADQHFDGGSGFNTLNYSEANHALEIDLSQGKASGEDIGNDTFINIQHFIGGSADNHFTIGSGNFALDARGGKDTFSFLSGDSSSYTQAHIRGFAVGDHIEISKYDMFEQSGEAEDDRFSKIYVAKDDAPDPKVHDAVVPIRIRHEDIAGVQKTWVDGNVDEQGNYHTTIELDGEHHIVVNGHLI